MNERFRITPTQMDAFRSAVRAQFVEMMVTRLTELLKEHPIARDTPAMHELIEWGLVLADRLMIVQRSDVVRFLDLFAHADVGFPVLPQWEWVRLILANTEKLPQHRLDDVYAELLLMAPRNAS